MITLEDWHTIRTLARRGHSQRWIASSLGMSRKTVARAIAQTELSSYRRAPTAREELEAFRCSVEEALQQGHCGINILESVRQSGYTSSGATFYRWLATVRADLSRRGSSCRFETGPGIQAQFDWSPYIVLIGGAEVSVRMYALTLGYSRRVHWYPSLSEKQDSVHEALEACFCHFGGCCRSVVIDNSKTMVLRHRHKDIVWNQCFLGLCGHYRIQPIAATPVHPQTKGKVENPFRTLERRFLCGAVWRDWAHFEASLAEFERRWEKRIHPSTGMAPEQRFEEECPNLVPVPPKPFLGCRHQIRNVQNDGLFSWEGVRYCVPVEKGLGQVRVRTRQARELIVYDLAGNEVIRHDVRPKGSPPVLAEDCYKAHLNRRRASLRAVVREFRERYCDISPACELYLQRLLQQHENHPETAVGRVLDLLTNVPTEIAAAVLGDLAGANLVDMTSLQAVLTNRMKGTALVSEQPPLTGSCLPKLDVERPMSAYKGFLPQPTQQGEPK